MKQKRKPKAKRKRPKSVGRSNTDLKSDARSKYSNHWRGWTHKGWPTAKKNKQFVKAKDKYPYPSRYGSHSSMIVGKGELIHSDGSPSTPCVRMKDEHGEYLTSPKYIDSGLVDPNRARVAA